VKDLLPPESKKESLAKSMVLRSPTFSEAETTHEDMGDPRRDREHRSQAMPGRPSKWSVWPIEEWDPAPEGPEQRDASYASQTERDEPPMGQTRSEEQWDNMGQGSSEEQWDPVQGVSTHDCNAASPEIDRSMASIVQLEQITKDLEKAVDFAEQNAMQHKGQVQQQHDKLDAQAKKLYEATAAAMEMAHMEQATGDTSRGLYMRNPHSMQRAMNAHSGGLMESDPKKRFAAAMDNCRM